MRHHAVKLPVHLASAFVLAFILSTGAQADLVSGPFTDLGSLGFGNAPRLITISTPNGQTTTEEGGLTYNGATVGSSGVDSPGPQSAKNSTPTLATLGWATGANVGIGLNTIQAGTGLTVENISLAIYQTGNATAKFTASLAAPVTFSSADIIMQQGNGNGVFTFLLNAAQRTAFNTAIGSSALNTLIAVITDFKADNAAVSGAESLLGFNAANPTAAVPLPPAAWLFGSALAGLGLLSRRRRRLNATA